MPRRSWLALTLAASAFTIISINVTGTNIAFSAIETEFSASSRATLSWALSGYSIALATFMVLGGRLADRTGRRRIFYLGIVIFLVGSLACALAPHALVFIGGRAIQGLGGAFVVPSSLALVLPDFPTSRRTSAISVWTASGSTGAALAPSLTAFIVDFFGWRWVYILAIPVGLAILVAGRSLLQESKADAVDEKIDVLGFPLGTISIGLLAFVIVQGPRWGWLHPGILVSVSGVLILSPAFVIRSLRHRSPLLDLRLFKIRTVWTSSLANVFMSMMGLSIWLVWPLFLTGIWGYDLLHAGLAITPGPVCSAVFGLLAGRIADRHGPRLLISVGSLFPIFVTMWMLFRFDSEPDYWTTFFPAVVMFGTGFGLTFSPLNGAALRGVEPAVFGQVNAAFNTSRNLAGGLGVAIVIAIIGDADPIPLAAFQRVFMVFAVLSVMPAAIVYLLYPRD